MLVALKERNIRLLFIAQTISLTGSWVSLIALNLKIYQLSQSALGVALLFGLAALPALLLGIVGGVWIDRFNRQKLMVGCDLARAALVLPVIFVNELVALYALVFLTACAGTIYRVARLAITPQLVANPHQLLAANALFSLAQTLTLALGPGMGGVLVACLGFELAFALDAASFLLSAGLTARLILPATAKNQAPAGNTWGLIREGFGFIRQNRAVSIIILTTSLVTLGSGSINALEVVYARTILGVDETAFGLLISSWGVGLFVGTLVIGWLGTRFDLLRVLVGAVALLGLSLAVYGYAGQLWVALLLGVVGGFGNGLMFTVVQTLLQTLVPGPLLGRVGGVFTLARDLTALLSMALAGLVASFVYLPLIFLASGLVVLGSALFPALLSASRQERAAGSYQLSESK